MGVGIEYVLSDSLMFPTSFFKYGILFHTQIILSSQIFLSLYLFQHPFEKLTKYSSTISMYFNLVTIIKLLVFSVLTMTSSLYSKFPKYIPSIVSVLYLAVITMWYFSVLSMIYFFLLQFYFYLFVILLAEQEGRQRH